MITSYTAQQPVTDFGLRFAGSKWGAKLVQNAEQHFTVPGIASRYKAVFHFSFGASVWVADNATAAVAGSTFASGTSELNPVCREVVAGDVLSFVTADTAGAYVNVVFYAVGSPN